MTSSIDPRPAPHVRGRVEAPLWWRAVLVRTRATVRSRALDERLARGVDPQATPELARRAARLASPRYRRELGGRLVDILRAADTPGPRLSAAPPLRKAEVRAARGELLALADALRHEPRARPGGVACAQRLMSDGRGPFYVHAEEGALARAIEAALTALLPARAP